MQINLNNGIDFFVYNFYNFRRSIVSTTKKIIKRKSNNGKKGKNIKSNPKSNHPGYADFGPEILPKEKGSMSLGW